MTTLHSDSVAKIPDRMVNMAGSVASEARFLNNIYSFVDVGILIRRKEVRCADGRYRTIRSIEEVGFFSRERGRNICTMAVEEGQYTACPLPEEIAAAFRRAGIEGYSERKGIEADGREDRPERKEKEVVGRQHAMCADTAPGAGTVDGRQPIGKALLSGQETAPGTYDYDAGTGEAAGTDVLSEEESTDEDDGVLRFAADRIAVNTLEQGNFDAEAQQQRMDEIIEELMRLNRNGRTCLGRTSFVG